MNPIGVFDSGLARGALNHALDLHQFRLHQQGAAPDSLRFYRNTPTASLGLHQAAELELRLDYCRERGIEVVRRLSGGGALYLDPQQLGYSLLLRRPLHGREPDLAQWLERISRAVAAGLAALGIPAHFKFPNDVEVDGRKIASVFAAAQQETLLLHGTLLLEADIKTMLEALRAPTEKLSPDGLAAARDRLITVTECAGSSDLNKIKAALLAGFSSELEAEFGAETALAQDAPHELQECRLEPQPPLDGALQALLVTRGGTLRAWATFSGGGSRFARVRFAGDVHVLPQDFFLKLQGALTGLPVAAAADCVRRTLQTEKAQTAGFGENDLVRLLRQLMDKQSLLDTMGLNSAQVNALMTLGADVMHTLEHAEVMLVPYCAKPAWCKWRHRDGCTECGLCEVGDAYRLARERDMQVVTVTNYEHLTATLAKMKAQGARAYVGMCCSNFFIKRQRAFQEAGMPVVLMDIAGANCYELKQEDKAYAGTFRAEAKLDARLLSQVMKFVPLVNKPSMQESE